MHCHAGITDMNSVFLNTNAAVIIYDDHQNISVGKDYEQ